MTIGKDDYCADGWAVGRGHLRLHRHEFDGKPYWMGEYEHMLGTCTIYMQEGLTRLDYNFGGRINSRSWERQWGKRTLPSLCRDLMFDVRDTVLS